MNNLKNKNKILEYLMLLFAVIPFCLISFSFLSLKIYKTEYYDLRRELVEKIDFNFFQLVKNEIFGFSPMILVVLLLMIFVAGISVINILFKKKWTIFLLIAAATAMLIVFSSLNTLYCKSNGLLSANYIKKTKIPELYPNFPIIIEESTSYGEFYWMDLGVSSLISVFSYSGLLIVSFLGFFLKTNKTKDLDSLSATNTSNT